MKIIQKLKIYFKPSRFIDISELSLTNYKIIQIAFLLLLFFTIANYLSNGLFTHIFSSGFDYRLVYDAGKKIIHGNGNHIYDEFLGYEAGKSSLFYAYPAVVAVMCAPLSYLSFNTANTVFKIISQAFVFCSFFLLLNSMGKLKQAEKLLFFFIFFNFYPGFLSLQAGQSEYILLTLLLLFIHYFRNKKDLYSAFFLSLVIFFKLFPAVFLLYFLWKKEYKYCLITAAMLLCIGCLSLMYVDFETQKNYLLNIISFEQLDSFHDNQSITGFFSRLFTQSYFSRGWIDSRVLKQLLIYVSSIIIIIFTGKSVRRKLDRHDERYLHEFSIVIISMLMLSRFTDTHHFVFLLIPFSYLFKYYIRQKNTALRTMFLFIGCYAFFAAYTPLVSMRFIDAAVGSIFTHRYPILIPLLSFPLYAVIILWLINLNVLSPVKEHADIIE